MVRNGWFYTERLDRHYKDGVLHNEDGPAVISNSNLNPNYLWYVDGRICLTVQDWANKLIELGYKTKDEAIMAILKWSEI